MKKKTASLSHLQMKTLHVGGPFRILGGYLTIIKRDMLQGLICVMDITQKEGAKVGRVYLSAGVLVMCSPKRVFALITKIKHMMTIRILVTVIVRLLAGAIVIAMDSPKSTLMELDVDSIIGIRPKII